uniref:BTB domain-containing protein n=1 Tax=Meloidogyne hapla TaxID=6305 RepID=A0A1I8B1K6_MELHA
MCEQKAMIEARSGMVTLTDITPVNLRGTTDRIAITPESVKAMLEFFYTGTISEGVKNFVQYCAIIDLYGAPILLEACLAFICTNKKTFLDSKEWKEVESKYSQLATQLMKRGFMSDDN